MPVEIPLLATLNVDDVNQAQSLLAQLLTEFAPSAELRRSVIGDNLLHLNAVLQAGTRDLIAQIQTSSGLAGLQGDPSLIDEGTADAFFANFLTTRRPGAEASGRITIIMSDADEANGLSIITGSQFTIDGRLFETTQDYRVRADEDDVTDSTDVLLRTTPDGNVAFTIYVSATEVGSLYNVSRLLPVALATPPTSFVRAYTETDFTGGITAETMSDAAQRLREGVAARGCSNRIAVAALLRDVDSLSDIGAVSVIGYGDTEQRRYHSIFPVSLGSRLDVYVRTQPLYDEITVTKTAVLVANTAGVGTWQLTFTRDEHPGFYEITKIVHAGDKTSSGYTPDSDVRSYDLADAVPELDVTSGDEATYSRYQTAVIRFDDPSIDATNLGINFTSANYDVTLRVMPRIADVQERLADDDYGSYGADALAKAPVPCFLGISFEIVKEAGEPDPDTDAIKEALANTVNGLGFVARLPASLLLSKIHAHLLATQTVQNFDIAGRIRQPNGTDTFIRDGNVLEVPDEPEEMVSGRTVAFYLRPADISIIIETVSW